MVVFIHSILQKLRSALKNERGEANYFSTVVFIFIAVVLLAFIIDLFGIISTKQELDHAADQMVKQIQLSGGINSETDALFDFLCSEIEGADNITYSIDATYKSPTPSGMSRPSSWERPSILPLRGMPSWAASGIWIWSTSRWWPAAPALANITGSEVAYEAFILTAAPAAPQRAGEITFFACFFVVGVVMLISFLLLYASVRITCINIRNGAKMELNNLSATIYADTYRSQRETNFEEYLRTLYSSRDYTEMLEATVAGGLAEKVPLSTDDYTVSDISLEFNVVGDRVEYIFYCDVDFYVRMFGHSYPTITQRVELTGYHNTKF